MARREEKDQRYKVRQLKTMLLIREELRASNEKERSLAQVDSERAVCLYLSGREVFCAQRFYVNRENKIYWYNK